MQNDALYEFPTDYLRQAAALSRRFRDARESLDEAQYARMRVLLAKVRAGFGLLAMLMRRLGMLDRDVRRHAELLEIGPPVPGYMLEADALREVHKELGMLLAALNVASRSLDNSLAESESAGAFSEAEHAIAASHGVLLELEKRAGLNRQALRRFMWPSSCNLLTAFDDDALALALLNWCRANTRSVYLAKPDSSDLIAMGGFAAVVDVAWYGEHAWENYCQVREEAAEPLPLGFLAHCPELEREDIFGADERPVILLVRDRADPRGVRVPRSNPDVAYCVPISDVSRVLSLLDAFIRVP